MTEMTIVSVTDGRKVNINAALVLFLNLIDVCRCHFPMYLLTFKNQLSRRYIDFFRDIGVRLLMYDLPEEIMPDDPYRVKYLIKYFVDEVSSDRDGIVYLDPDHTVQNDSAFNGVEQRNGELIVSSEVKCYKNGSVVGNHFNTSLMMARAGVLRNVFDGWLQEYESIRYDVGVRYREEIAMAIAADKQHVAVKPCNPLFQCTLDQYLPESLLCHYGGDSDAVVMIKKILDCDDYCRIMQELGRSAYAETETGQRIVAGQIRTYIHIIQKEFV
jgi:hypothetical protein